MQGRNNISGVPTSGAYRVNDPRFWENLAQPQQFPNALKDFTHPGKDPRELLMRTIFKDEREANAAVLYYSKCIEFGLKEETEIFLNWLASRPSIKGISRRELLMGATNIVAPSLYPGISTFGRHGQKNGDGRKEEG